MDAIFIHHMICYCYNSPYHIIHVVYYTNWDLWVTILANVYYTKAVYNSINNYAHMSVSEKHTHIKYV